MITDARGVVRAADQAAAALLARSPRDLVGHTLPDVLAPDDRGALHARIRELERGAPGLEWEMTLAPEGQRSVSALLTVAALREPSGRLASLHWVIRDISAWTRWAVSDRVTDTVSAHLLDGASLRHILARVCEELTRLLPYPLVQVVTRETGDLALCAQAGASRLNAEETGAAWTSEERRRLESVLAARATLHLREPIDPADGTTRADDRYPARLLVPLCARDDAMGVLVVCGAHRETFDPPAVQWCETLARRIMAWMSMHRDMAARKAVEARFFHLAHHDALTDLPNRMLFFDRLTQALAQARRHGRGVGVLFLDLDRFKAVNDSLGHEMGDRLLKIVADRLTRGVRAADTVARFGGDEFAVILQDVDHARDAGHVARKLLQSIVRPAAMDGRRVRITASVGIAVYPVNATEPEALIARADRAMYRVKERGGHGCQAVSDGA